MFEPMLLQGINQFGLWVQMPIKLRFLFSVLLELQTLKYLFSVSPLCLYMIYVNFVAVRAWLFGNSFLFYCKQVFSIGEVGISLEMNL